ncbi:hypothetical protein SAMN04489761_3050 [Tenacibaculum sp. MAR_2009_124]|uniref:hypothetical protein n=1 Tax=Tenacibaculum sp. MAR_2009_124 TaxID=1250059 RepID=UPI0008951BF9|nr:hypothetical protein [Tenacibaculum sp. MAR_2009_124]SEC45862.1 hypothetical protein SAMN04489761_3050 [Tenacibaculum sp. MAR_2009_124]
MSNTVNVQEIKAELDEHIHKNTSVIATGVYNSKVQLDQYCRTISKINGKYPQFHKIMTHVVQGFKAEWQAMGAMQFNAKIHQDFRQKVNLPIIVDNIYNTWLSYLAVEGKKPAEQPLTKMIIKELLEKVIDDLSELSVTGYFDPAKAAGEFGYSLDGIASVITKNLTNEKYPFFKIPIDVITDANILDQFKAYERSIPSKVRKRIEYVFMSPDMKVRYGDAFVEKYGTHTNFDDARKSKTETFGFEIVGLEGLPDGIIFSTVKDNMLKLVDVIDGKPKITDTQIQDYVLKIFLEFHLGYDFAINQLVFVADFSGTAFKGLGNAKMNELYYSSEKLN